ncbi:MAG: AAA family ATPase [Syntrophorhabdaceae bacterium]|nr:AAA family ATPase [Syntrophorhabdaceae bacterium]
MITRIARDYIFDPEINTDKMIFLTGPRQIGKTTFALEWLKEMKMEDMYFNWDNPSTIIQYKRNPLIFKNLIDERYNDYPVPLVFDEIHKQKNWRDILKGIYDISKEKMMLLVTGSARLGYFRKTGDSLIGRYFLYQLLPIGLPEIISDFSYIIKDGSIFSSGDAFIRLIRSVNTKNYHDNYERLMLYGGFPEPLSRSSKRFFTRWQREYKTLITKEETRDLTKISDLRGIEQLVEILPERVGSPLSINSLCEDLSYHHATITNWIQILSTLYLVFTIRPWHRSLTRSIKKETKLYFFDWTNVKDRGFRFENFIAVTLIKMATRLTETGVGVYEIMYIRDREKREVDFVLIEDGKPLALFEAKEGETSLSTSGRYFSERLNIPFYQIVNRDIKPEEYKGNCYIIPSIAFNMVTG